MISDYETHGIESKLSKELSNNNSGYWLLTAGPGMGKSTILASLFKQKASTGNCITYFFREEFDGSLRNKVRNFQTYLAIALSETYPHLPIEFSANEDFASLISSHLLQLSIEGSIRKDSPLFIFVDALDEMDVHDRRKSDELNPLEFPDNLPEGVFIVCTLRQSPEPTRKINQILPSKHRKIPIDGSKHQKIHQDTTRRYIRRFCEKHRFITPYWDDTGRSKKTARQEDFVRWLAEKAGYNFMILRCILHDRIYWEEGGTGIDIVANLTDFYEIQFQRMAEQRQSRNNYLAIFCLGVQSSLYVQTFHQLLDTNISDHNSQDRERLLDNWIDQGLVVTDGRRSRPSIRAYHFTFREFLKEEFRKQRDDDVLKPFLANLVAGLLHEDSFSPDNSSGMSI